MYEIPLKKDTQLVVMISTPYKEALMRLAYKTGTDMSNLVRQAIAEYVDSHHDAAFNTIYDESIQDFVNKEKK